MKIAVTGASGFIGRHVCAALRGHGNVEVVTVSRSPRDDAVASTLASVAASPGASADAFAAASAPTFAPAHAFAGAFAPGSASTSAAAISASAPAAHRHVTLDIGEPSVDDYERLGRPDVLLHLAWGGLPNYRSAHHFEIELGRHYRFLANLVRAGLPALVCTGTCLEYGMRSGALDESLLPDPITPYGFAKDALRRELAFLRETQPFGLTWARLFYMYGSGQATSSLYPQLMAAAQRGERSFRMSGGQQLRDYLPVSDVAASLVALALRAPDAGVLNVCSGEPVSVRALVEGWIREQGWDIELELGHYPYPDYEPMAFWGRNERLKSVLGGSH